MEKGNSTIRLKKYFCLAICREFAATSDSIPKDLVATRFGYEADDWNWAIKQMQGMGYVLSERNGWFFAIDSKPETDEVKRIRRQMEERAALQKRIDEINSEIGGAD